MLLACDLGLLNIFWHYPGNPAVPLKSHYDSRWLLFHHKQLFPRQRIWGSFSLYSLRHYLSCCRHTCLCCTYRPVSRPQSTPDMQGCFPDLICPEISFYIRLCTKLKGKFLIISCHKIRGYLFSGPYHPWYIIIHSMMA